MCSGNKCLSLVFLFVEAVDSNTLINFVLHRDFAYVARDKDTRILKCHVFRCDTPAKAIATSLHEICSKVNLLSVPFLSSERGAFLAFCKDMLSPYLAMVSPM